ncbi:helix-turn-helix transcriptional regulator [Bacillus sp. EKM417B]|nr:helix-turn-helix transcriptional regulator [Bacillus sp. EKM420B]KAF6607651.1 helix-turn-helix transcriptional regulator [Bacillus sp. EKM417B]
MESFGKQLRTLREKRHLTVNQLATYSGVSKYFDFIAAEAKKRSPDSSSSF